MTLENKRFMIKYGRFGAYFYDNILKKDVDMKEVQTMLNEWNSIMKIGKALEGYQR